MQYGSPTSTYSAKLEANGRIVIPARVREALGLVAGAELSLTVEGDALLVRSKRATVKRVRERLRAQLPPNGAAGTSGVDAFLAERHEDDARRELRLDQLLHRRSAP
jgi:AbrB family looped-hinge helix DNA binding protein